MRWRDTLTGFGLCASVALSSCGSEKPTQPTSDITFVIAGAFSDTLNPEKGNLDPQDYPYPNLLGGTFFGTFSYSPVADVLETLPTWKSFQLSEVNIELRDRTGSVVFVIERSDNGMRILNDGSGAYLFFGQSSGTRLIPSDLRIYLNGHFSPNQPPNPDSLQVGNMFEGLMEVDGAENWTFWDVDVKWSSLKLVNE
jgi:hypothetical protein